MWDRMTDEQKQRYVGTTQSELETSRNKLIEAYRSDETVREALESSGILEENIQALTKKEIIAFLKKYC